jgi:hypothetical protein
MTSTLLRFCRSLCLMTKAFSMTFSFSVEIYSSMKPCEFSIMNNKNFSIEVEFNNLLKVLEIGGLQYFSLKSLTPENFNKRPSILRTIFLILRTCFFVTFLYATVVDLSKVPDGLTVNNIIMFMAKKFLNVAISLTMLIGLFNSYATTSANKEIFKNFNEILKIVTESFEIEIGLDSLKVSLIWKLVAILSCFGVLHGFIGCISITSIIEIIPILISAIPYLFLLLIMYKTVFYVSFINSTLELLNKIIVDIFQFHPIKISENINYHLTNVKDKRDPFERLQKCRRIFNLAFAAANLFNRCIGLTFFAILCTLATSLVLSGYEIFIFATTDQLIETLSMKSLKNLRAQNEFLSDFRF